MGGTCTLLLSTDTAWAALHWTRTQAAASVDNPGLLTCCVLQGDCDHTWTTSEWSLCILHCRWRLNQDNLHCGRTWAEPLARWWRWQSQQKQTHETQETQAMPPIIWWMRALSHSLFLQISLLWHSLKPPWTEPWIRCSSRSPKSLLKKPGTSVRGHL